MGQLLISCAGNVVNLRAEQLFKHDDSGARGMNAQKRNSGRNKFVGRSLLDVSIIIIIVIMTKMTEYMCRTELVKIDEIYYRAHRKHIENIMYDFKSSKYHKKRTLFLKII